ncbi:putative ribonuclease h protein [Fagus crenata]
MWKHLWKLKIPNKVKFHIWRACLNALPTRCSLCRRRILQDPCCPICNSTSETTTHTLWACPYAVSVWALSPGRLQKLPSSEVDFFLLARQFFQDMACEMRELWAVTCWAIWYARNKFIHESLLLPPQQTLDMATRLLRDYQIVKSGQHLISSGMR